MSFIVVQYAIGHAPEPSWRPRLQAGIARESRHDIPVWVMREAVWRPALMAQERRLEQPRARVERVQPTRAIDAVEDVAPRQELEYCDEAIFPNAFLATYLQNIFFSVVQLHLTCLLLI